MKEPLVCHTASPSPFTYMKESNPENQGLSAGFLATNTQKNMGERKRDPEKRPFK